MAAGRKERSSKMSVIGRLDKQVEEVLISPLDKNRRQTETPRDSPSRQDATPDAQPESVTHKDENVHPEREQEELPVWLL
jgi:hypothetical protein